VRTNTSAAKHVTSLAQELLRNEGRPELTTEQEAAVHQAVARLYGVPAGPAMTKAEWEREVAERRR